LYNSDIGSQIETWYGMRKNHFKYKKFYHLNLDFETHPLFKELDWIFIQKKIQTVSEQFNISVNALVMMDTHIHLLICSDNHSENFFCEKIQNEISPKRQSDCFCEPIVSYSQYLNAYKYLYRNPIEAGLVQKVEQYKFSSLQIILGKSVGYVQLDDQLAIIQNPLQILKWLNSDGDFKVSQLKLLRQDNSLSM
jgi:putative transposase